MTRVHQNNLILTSALLTGSLVAFSDIWKPLFSIERELTTPILVFEFLCYLGTTIFVFHKIKASALKSDPIEPTYFPVFFKAGMFLFLSIGFIRGFYNYFFITVIFPDYFKPLLDNSYQEALKIMSESPNAIVLEENLDVQSSLQSNPFFVVFSTMLIGLIHGILFSVIGGVIYRTRNPSRLNPNGNI